MLKGINPLLNPDVLHALAAMGHGDTLAIVDSNFPAYSISTNTTYQQALRMDCSMPASLQAILSLFPIDTFVDDPVNAMQVVGNPNAIPEVITEASNILAPQHVNITSIERFKFYEATKQAFVIIQTNETRVYGNLILSKGVIS